MEIQVIRHAINPVEKDGMTFSPLKAPRAMDDFEINIIDLSVHSMWTSYTDVLGKIDAFRDLDTIQQMVSNKKNAVVVYVLPQNIQYTYDTKYSTPKRIALKDILDGVQKHSTALAIPLNTAMSKLAYEKTETSILGHKFDADFCFTNPESIVTMSEKSEKPTTIEILPQVYVTTLAITKSDADIKYFVSSLFEKHEQTEAPPWMKDVCFGDDAFQNRQIEQCKAKIETAQAQIATAEKKLQENAKYKSILYTNGDELVEVVFDILEKILACDLSTFVDNKKEDFLVKLPTCTLIGEIKGVTSNVKSEHISQVDVHYQGYMDKLTEQQLQENVRQVLIINPFRTKPLEQRDPVHDIQISLAKRNGCLIIETNTLLHAFEFFLQGNLSTEDIWTILSQRTGILSISDLQK